MSGVYISYPFCGRKCTYCNFLSGPFPPALEQEYLRALQDELERWSWSWQPETLYLGGGSPSRMDLRALEKLLGQIPGRPWKEATIEVVPGEVTLEKARCWAALGFSRASLGAQSFVEQELRATGRAYTASTVQRDMELLREAGIEHINIDLIAGLPYQTPRSWEVSLHQIERLQPDHVSVYLLEIDEKSRLGRELLAGGSRYHARAVPTEEAVVQLYEMAVEFLEGLGLLQYEISNFARPGCESAHNLKYWRLEPYAGFGADAHSFDGTWRWRNAATARDYVERWRAGLPFEVERVPADLPSERLFLGLRLRQGIHLTAGEQQRFGAVLARFAAEGLVELHDHHVRLTRQGVLLSNEVFQAFL